MIAKMTKFRVGDRVRRRRDVYDLKSLYRAGVVIEVYADLDAKFGPYQELYKVRWERESKISSGYLPHGLDKG